jgi:predicted metalloendopeptidase
MAYRYFKTKDLEEKFGIEEVVTNVFDYQKISKKEPSDNLKRSISEAGYLTLSSKLAISAQIVAPVLAELRKNNDKFQIFSGESIVGDKKLGLNGLTDFIFASTPMTSLPNTPIFLLIKQSKSANLKTVYPKAIAQMLGIRYFNKIRSSDIETIHAVVTDGTTWHILKLEGNNVLIDKHNYSTENLPLLLGVLQEIINFYKK